MNYVVSSAGLFLCTEKTQTHQKNSNFLKKTRIFKKKTQAPWSEKNLYKILGVAIFIEDLLRNFCWICQEIFVEFVKKW